MADSFAGEAGLPSFKTKMKRLLDVISAQGTNPPVRIVLLSPIRHEKLPPPLPDAAPHNRQLSAYATALRQIAEERRCAFIDLTELTAALERSPAPRH